MKKLSILFAALLVFSACADEQFPAASVPDDEAPVRVGFSLRATLDTDTSLEPMTRAVTDYKNWIHNKCQLLILRKTDTRWIVDKRDSLYLNPAEMESWSHEEKLTDLLSPLPFYCELRPGDYRIVAVLNAYWTDFNEALKPGTVVADTSDPALLTPPLLTYSISKYWANPGYRSLAREVFVAVSDFTVPRSSNLHGTAMPAVELHAERRVGKFRILLKGEVSPNGKNFFETTAHTPYIVLKAKNGAFAEGIDALGGMYYGPQKLVELPWCMMTFSDFHPSGGSKYQLCQTNSSVFSPFLFADPAVDKLSFEITDIYIMGASGGYTYRTYETFSRDLAVNKITGIVFQTIDTVYTVGSQSDIGITEATDENGVPEDAVTLFDPFYEWNASSE